MKLRSRPILLLICAGIAALVVIGAWLQRRESNPVYPAIESLAGVPFGERWSHPEMLKIRAMGDKAIFPLRIILKEKESNRVRFLLWVKSKQPRATNYFAHFPNQQRLSDRRWAACQALQMFGRAARPAIPELIDLLKSYDPADLNAAIMALHAVGIDADICDRLCDLIEQKTAAPFAYTSILYALGTVKPPSSRAVRIAMKALNDQSNYVVHRAAECLGHLGVATPEIIAALKLVQTNPTNESAAIAASTALWELQKDSTAALPPVLKILNQKLERPYVPMPGGGNGGQALTEDEELFLDATVLFQKAPRTDAEKAKILAMLDRWCEKSGRIFVSMLLLPTMLDLDYLEADSLAVCLRGLRQEEDYYRIQAARLLLSVTEKHPNAKFELEPLLNDKFIGVRVYAARIHWRRNHGAKTVLPILVDALNRSKYQSYYYPEILDTALKGLGEIGPEARGALVELERLQADPNPAVAKEAGLALLRIRSVGAPQKLY